MASWDEILQQGCVVATFTIVSKFISTFTTVNQRYVGIIYEYIFIYNTCAVFKYVRVEFVLSIKNYRKGKKPFGPCYN